MSKQEATSAEKRKTAIDWNEIHNRLEKVKNTFEKGFELSIEEQQKILKARAKTLAKESVKRGVVEESIKVLEFQLAHEKYAVESVYIREVLPLKELTPLSCTPPFVLGIINVRGQILSVLDIKKFFDLPEKGLTQLNKVIILRSEKPALSKAEGMEFGILADEIVGVQSILTGDLQPSLPTLTGIREEYLKGVTKEGLVLLDSDKLLSDKNIIVNEEVNI